MKNQQERALEEDLETNEETQDTVEDDISNLAGREKVAILLATLGLEQSAKILQGLELPDDVTTTLLEQIASFDRVAPKKVKATIREGVEYIKGGASMDNVKAGPAYVQSLLQQTFGEKKSREMLRRMGETSAILRRLTREKTAIFQFVSDEYIDETTKILLDEHPQTVALILGHLENEISGEILGKLPLEMQHDVIRRLSKIKSVELETIKEAGKMLRKKLRIDVGLRRSKFFGTDSAVEVLNATPKPVQDNIIGRLTEEDPDLAYEIERGLFRFESLQRMGDRELVMILQDIEPQAIAYSTRGITEALKERLLSCVPKRKRELIEEELGNLPDRVLIRDVEDAQHTIIGRAQGLSESGEISLVLDENEYI